MSSDRPSILMEDEHQIANLLIRWGHARESDDWETLAGCFHDNATIHAAIILMENKDEIIERRR